MPTQVIDSVMRLIEATFGYSVGTSGFNIMLGVCFFAWVLVARVFMALFSSNRGILAAFLAFALPVGLGLLAYGMAELHLVPLVDRGWLATALPGVAFGLMLLLAVLVIVRRIFALSSGVSLFIYLVATSAAIGAYFGAQVTMGVIEYGENQVEQRDQRVTEELDQLF
ncbi:hypothetical protein ACWPKO_04425 [Coraliomargarita sp. W4R53]